MIIKPFDIAVMRFILLLGICLLCGCNSEDAPDCFQRTGNTIQRKVEVASFTRILVNPNIELVLKQGSITQVVIETGDNLINEVTAEVKEDRLILSNTNDCAFFRGFNQTKIYVTAPNITEIRSATQFDISSDGVLKFPKLNVISEDFIEESGNTTGTFHLNVDLENLEVLGNNIATFFIKGKVTSLTVNFASGTGRFEGEGLEAERVTVNHRGANKIIVNPLQSIEGEIRSTGDLILVNEPSIINVKEFFTGRLVVL
ncbi:head GIN domain-containing protein [Aquimarina sp. 2201CG1-2-11]|uniref:head GIN domain-containing protein n=1 Tax=Aquimarina discodermiae TaxID=3231043 RepID=UPI003462DC30